MNHHFTDMTGSHGMCTVVVNKIKIEPFENEKVLVQRDEERNHESYESEEVKEDRFAKIEPRDTTIPCLYNFDRLNLRDKSHNAKANSIIGSLSPMIYPRYANNADELEDVSVYSVATYDTNGTSESSVYDIISRLQHETQRRRRRIMRRRSGRDEKSLMPKMFDINTIEE